MLHNFTEIVRAVACNGSITLPNLLSVSEREFDISPPKKASEIMTILVIFHTCRFRDLKSFYPYYVCRHMREEFSPYHLLQPFRRAAGIGGDAPAAVP